MEIGSWTKEDVALLELYYPEHGPSWDGWTELLPNRSVNAITSMARSFGIRKATKKPKPSPDLAHRVVRFELRPDPYEREVVAMMEAGLTPTQIDQRKHWFRGTARLIMSNRWKRERDAETD